MQHVTADSPPSRNKLNPLIRLCDFIFVLRPLILIPAWSFFLIGAAQSSGSGLPAGSFPPATVLKSLTAILIVAYLINQIFDKDADRRNNKIFYLANGIFSEWMLLVIAGAFFVVASVTFQAAENFQRGPLVLALFLALVYSLPPIRLCARPVLDVGANAVGYGGIAFVLGHTVFNPSLRDALGESIPYMLMVGATFLHTTILDVEGDRDSGKVSTAVWIGVKRSAILAVGLHAAAVVVAALSGHMMTLAVTGIGFPISVYACVRTNKRTSSALVQSSILIVTVAAVVAWPVYLSIVLPLVLLARYYYKRRFGITYPGPAGSA
ncbi:MAG: UbiA family prenyltransferase [bacterium]|nr:UbiA family prenyltransferase [bacterium]